MWIDTTTFPPYKPNLKKNLPSGRASAPRRREGAGVSPSVCTGNPALGSPLSLQEPRDCAHFSGGRKVLDSFFQFSVLSINKPPERASFGPARGGRQEGLGRGEGFAQFQKKIPSLRLAPFPAGLSGSERTHSSWVAGDATQQDAPSPAQDCTGSRQGPPQRRGVRRLRRGPGSRLQPSPSGDRIPS